MSAALSVRTTLRMRQQALQNQARRLAQEIATGEQTLREKRERLEDALKECALLDVMIDRLNGERA